MSRESAAAPRTDALEAAVEWRLIALLLARPRPGWHEEVRAVAAEVRDPELREAAAHAPQASEGTYLRVVGPGGTVSPREVTYRPLEDPGWVLADLRRYYEAFAFRPCGEDPLDHVATEADFVGYLYLKEAFACARGETETAEVTATARASFLAAHLAPLAAPLARGIGTGGPAHLAGAARALAARVPAPVRRTTGSDPPPESSDIAGDCGSCRAFD